MRRFENIEIGVRPEVKAPTAAEGMISVKMSCLLPGWGMLFLCWNTLDGIWGGCAGSEVWGGGWFEGWFEAWRAKLRGGGRLQA